MKRTLPFCLFLTLLFGLYLGTAHAEALAPAVAAVALPQPGLNTLRETPPEETEGGFVFYNRQYISATLGKLRQLLLTFDDGPHPQVTPQVLDILKRWNLKGIFFVTGRNAQRYPQLIKRIHDEGHTIGNHTWGHPKLTKLTTEALSREIRSTNELICRLTGFTPRLFRPPYGLINASVLQTLKAENMDPMLWTFDPREWRTHSIDRTVAILRQQMKLNAGGKGGVILLHDTMPATAGALEPLLTALAQQQLLPTAFARSGRNERSYWAMKAPVLLPWHQGADLRFRFEDIQRPALAAIYHPRLETEISSVALMRAKKAGSLFTLLLTRAF